MIEKNERKKKCIAQEQGQSYTFFLIATRERIEKGCLKNQIDVYAYKIITLAYFVLRYET